MKKNKYNGILKGCLALAVVLLMESSHTADASGTVYGKYGTFDVNKSAESAKEGDVVGAGETGKKDDDSADNSTDSPSSVGDKFSQLGEGNGLSGLPGKIPSSTLLHPSA